MEKIPIHLFWKLGKDLPLILRLSGHCLARTFTFLLQGCPREAATGAGWKEGMPWQKEKIQGGHGFLFEISHLYPSNQNACCASTQWYLLMTPLKHRLERAFGGRKKKAFILHRRGGRVSIVWCSQGSPYVWSGPRGELGSPPAQPSPALRVSVLRVQIHSAGKRALQLAGT